MPTNLPITLSLDPDNINENGLTELLGTIEGLNPGNDATVTINWGDPNDPTNTEITVTADADGKATFKVPHTYLDDGFAPGNNTPFDLSTITVDVEEDTFLVETDAMFVIDVSTSTGAQFQGTAVGDVNGDGFSNTILDAQLDGFIQVNDELIQRGLTNARVSIVVFGGTAATLDMNPSTSTVELFTTPGADLDNDGTLDVEQVLKSINFAGGFSGPSPVVDGTNFENALIEARTTLDVISPPDAVNPPATHGVFFTSDGASINSGEAVANEIKGPTRGHTIQAVGIGSNSDLTQLNDITSNPPAVQVTSTDQLRDVLTGKGEFEGGTGNATVDVTVNNVAPTVELDSAGMINENDTFTLMGMFTDIGLLDEHVVVVDWDDPNNDFDSTFALADTNSLTVGDTFNSTTDDAVLEVTAIDTDTGKVSFEVADHQYLDDGPAPGNDTASDTSIIEVTVTDDDTGEGKAQEELLVKNVAPMITSIESEFIVIDDDDDDDDDDEGLLFNDDGDDDGDDNEGLLINIEGTFTDPGSLDLHTGTAHWSDGFSMDLDEITFDGFNGTFTTSRFLTEDELEDNFPEVEIDDDLIFGFDDDDAFKVGVTIKISDDDTGMDEDSIEFLVPEPD